MDDIMDGLTKKQQAELKRAFKAIVRQYKEALKIAYINHPLDYAIYNVWKNMEERKERK